MFEPKRLSNLDNYKLWNLRSFKEPRAQVSIIWITKPALKYCAHIVNSVKKIFNSAHPKWTVSYKSGLQHTHLKVPYTFLFWFSATDAIRHSEFLAQRYFFIWFQTRFCLQMSLCLIHMVFQLWIKFDYTKLNPLRRSVGYLK